MSGKGKHTHSGEGGGEGDASSTKKQRCDWRGAYANRMTKHKQMELSQGRQDDVQTKYYVGQCVYRGSREAVVVDAYEAEEYLVRYVVTNDIEKLDGRILSKYQKKEKKKEEKEKNTRKGTRLTRSRTRDSDVVIQLGTESLNGASSMPNSLRKLQDHNRKGFDEMGLSQFGKDF